MFLRLLVLVMAAATPTTAAAGMPAITLHDLVKLRLEVISFFLVVLLLCAAAVYGLWNWLRADFAWLPRLTYTKACGIVTLWGILFVVVLTMISGARELMTPGAWERDGWTYRLASDEETAEDSHDVLAEREEGLVRLRATLMGYAGDHTGEFPASDELDKLPQDLFAIPGRPGLQYVYVPAKTLRDKDSLLAYEPTVYGEESLVLLTHGEIVPMSHTQIEQLRAEETSSHAAP